MGRESALERLTDPSSDVRLRAARELASVALPSDEGLLRQRRRVESVPWVRAAIERALAAISLGNASDDEPPRDWPDEEPDLASQYLAGLQLATDRMVHELRSIVGTLRYWAEKEHESYGQSQTERQVDRLRRCLEAIDYLGKMARSPKNEEFDLARVIDDEVSAVEALGPSTPRIGKRPFVVWGDSGILGIVLRNAINNAVEAAVAEPPSVHINWGETEAEYWVAVFDRGPGLPREAEALFDFGSSTKPGHVGAGLAIVSQAAVALDGEVFITEEADGTTKFEFRWPQTTERDSADPAG